MYHYLYAENTCGMKVIDAEMERRKLLAETPVDSIYGQPVNFDTQSIPWWAWVRRFHLPEVQLLFWAINIFLFALQWVL